MTIRIFYRLLAAVLSLFIIGSTIAIIFAFQANRQNAELINLAGRQRLLIQTMRLELAHIQAGAGPAARQSLDEAAYGYFEPTLRALIAGGPAPLDSENSVTLPPAQSPNILAHLESIWANWQEISPALDVVLVEEPHTPAFQEAAAMIETLSPVLLAQTDQAVSLYERTAGRKIDRLRLVATALVALAGLLLGAGLFVVNRQIVQPIAALEESIRQIGQGDLDAPIVAVGGLQEVDRLAGRLNEMRRQLRDVMAGQQRRAEESETLRHAISVVLSTLQPEEAIERILEQLARVVPYDSASVQLLRDGYLEIVGGRGWPDVDAVIGVRFPASGDNPNSVVIRERRPHILADAPAAYAAFRQAPHDHIRSWMGIPLLIRDQIMGMLAIDSAQPNYFEPHHARLAVAFAEQVTIALENARLFQAEQEARMAATALLEITQVAGSSLELTAVLKEITQRTALACQAHRCTIFLLDESGDYLQPAMSQFADERVDRELWQLFKSTTADHVDTAPLFRTALNEKRPMLLDDAARIDLVPPKWTQPFAIRKMLVVPLVSREESIGLLALDHVDAGRYFTQEQIDLAVTIGGQTAGAIVNARLYDMANRRARELTVLARVGEVLNQAQSAEEALQLTLSEALQLIQGDQGSVLLLEPDGETLRIAAHIGLSDEEVAAFNKRPATRHIGTFVESIGQGRLVEVADTSTDPRVARIYSFHLPPQLTNVPLKTDQGVIGVLALNGLPQDDQARRLLRALADLAAVAIEKARLWEKTRRRANQLHAVYEASRMLTSDLRLEVVLQRLVEIAAALTSAHYGALLILDEEGQDTAHFYTTGLSEAEREHMGRLPQPQGLLQTVLQTDRVVRLADLTQHEDAQGLPLDHPAMKSFLGVAIKARNRVIGALYITEKGGGRSFSRTDEELVSWLATDAAMAIENAQLFNQVQQLAITDSLTGLFNRRHFFTLAKREFARARRYNRPLAALMVDVNNFKPINDVYGHSIGDRALQEVARRCQENLRQVDILGRYGGDEFVALLPESDYEQANQAAERLRAAFREKPISSDRGPLPITISVGVAALSEECPDLSALLDQADAALYATKPAAK